jgi:hypothetical protein
MLLEQRGQRGCRMLVREKVLDGCEAVARSGAEAVEKAVFREHHGQICGKARHGSYSIQRLSVDRQVYGPLSSLSFGAADCDVA